jgi:hypothetical protein
MALEPKELGIAEMLLSLPEEGTQDERVLRELGAAKAVDLLERVLLVPGDWSMSGIGEPVGDVHLWRKYRLGRATMRLEHILVGTTGFLVVAAISTMWPHVGLWPRRHKLQWAGFSRVVDDLGTTYVETAWDPSSPEASGVSWVAQGFHGFWAPAPPADAKQLVLTTVQSFKVEDAGSGQVREVLLDECTCRVDLPEPEAEVGPPILRERLSEMTMQAVRIDRSHKKR